MAAILGKLATLFVDGFRIAEVVEWRLDKIMEAHRNNASDAVRYARLALDRMIAQWDLQVLEAMAHPRHMKLPLKNIFPSAAPTRPIDTGMLPILTDSIQRLGLQMPLDCIEAKPVHVEDSWKTSTVVAIAKRIWVESSWDVCPLLADALQDADCPNANALQFLRDADPDRPSAPVKGHTHYVRRLVAVLAGETLYDLINGHHRLKAIQMLGWKEADCTVYKFNSEQSKLLAEFGANAMIQPNYPPDGDDDDGTSDS